MFRVTPFLTHLFTSLLSSPTTIEYELLLTRPQLVSRASLSMSSHSQASTSTTSTTLTPPGAPALRRRKYHRKPPAPTWQAAIFTYENAKFARGH